MGIRKLTQPLYERAKRAIEFYDEGTPIKDAFETGEQERDVVIECLRIAVETYENATE
jgi:hypothetical protein